MKEFLMFWVGFVVLQLIIAGLMGWVAELSDLLLSDIQEDDNKEGGDEDGES